MSTALKRKPTRREQTEWNRERERTRLAWRYLFAKGYTGGGTAEEVAIQHAFLDGVRYGAIPLTVEEVDAVIEAKLATLACHPECAEHFREYGRASYEYPPAMRIDVADGGSFDGCQLCGTALLCGEVVRGHAWREVGFEECRRLGIFHAGRCYHVSRCVRCGTWTGHDTSD